MSSLGQIKASSEKLLSVGRDKVLAMRRDRHRQALLIQLGRACYDERSGKRDVDTQADIDELVAELMSMDEVGVLDEAAVDDPRAVKNV